MTTLFTRGGSLAALAASLALAVPATAQEMPDFQPDEPASARVRVERVEASGGPARAEIVRPERVAAPRFTPVAEQPRQAYTPSAPPPAFTRSAPITRVDPDIEAGTALAQRDSRRDRGERRSRGGFGSEIRAHAEAAQPAPPPPRAERAERSSRRGGDAGAWRGQRGGDRGGGWQRGDAAQAPRQDGWQGRTGADDGRRGDWQRRDGNPAGRRDESWGGGMRDAAREAARRDGWQNGGRGGDWQAGRRDDWRRDGRNDGWRRDGRGNDWRRDGRGNDWRRDNWRDGRRDNWRADRRDWRRDDWRWGWNGRPGWDNRDFRRWDNRWRANRSYDWLGWRNQNRFLFRPGPYFAPFRSHRYSRVNIGFFLDSLFFQPRFFINDPWAFRLPPAYGPYQWVRYYDDVLLVDIYTGEVVDVIHGFFW